MKKKRNWELRGLKIPDDLKIGKKTGLGEEELATYRASEGCGAIKQWINPEFQINRLYGKRKHRKISIITLLPQFAKKLISFPGKRSRQKVTKVVKNPQGKGKNACWGTTCGREEKA